MSDASDIDSPFIAELTLRRFRSHASFEGAFDGRPVAIFGPNGAGKTNILEAITMLSPGRGLRGAAAEEMAARPDPIGWSVAASIEGAEGRRSMLRSRSICGKAVGAKLCWTMKAAAQTALGSALRMVWLTPAMDRLWIEGASERRKFLDRLALLFEPAHAQAAAAYERAMRERNKLFKEQRRDAGWFAAIEARMAEAGAAVEAARARALERIVTAQSGGAFPEADLSIESADEGASSGPESAEHLALRYAAMRGREAAAGRSLIGPHRADLAAVYRTKEMPAKSCSTGEQKALLVSIVLAAARAARLEFGVAPLLLLDEVAAHFDADRRAALYDAILALRAQVWMTAAGAELFDELGDRAARVPLEAA